MRGFCHAARPGSDRRVRRPGRGLGMDRRLVQNCRDLAREDRFWRELVCRHLTVVTACPGCHYEVEGDPLDLFRLSDTTHALPTASSLRLRFDLTGSRLAGARTGDQRERIGLWSIGDARDYQILVYPSGRHAFPDDYLPAIHPNGRFAAIGRDDGVAIFDLESARELALVPTKPQDPKPPDPNGPRVIRLKPVNSPGCSVAFDGIGHLLINSWDGAYPWQVRLEAGHAGRVVPRPPRAPVAKSRDAFDRR